MCVIGLSKRWLLWFDCCCSVLVGCPDLVAVVKLLWVVCCELVTFLVARGGLLQVRRSFVAMGCSLWVPSCALVDVVRLLCAAGRSL